MLPIVLFVWGVVFYQVYVYFLSPPIYATKSVEKVINIDEIKIDTFSIVANYRDPFLGKIPKQRSFNNNSQISNNGASNTPKRKGSVTVKKTTEKWPVITYNGMIKNNSSNSKVAIITINGKEHLVKEGLDIKGLKISKIGKAAIKVRFQKENKTIVK